MRVGVYIDGFNLYYGGRSLCGRSTTGWRWLDLRLLSERLINNRRDWPTAILDRVVYCTARIDGATNQSGRLDQDRYLRGLRGNGSVDHVEFGNFVARVKYAPLVRKGPGGRPDLVTSDWPLMVKNANGDNVTDARFIVSYQHIEEKGSDVNVATHLVTDVLTKAVDAAIVISNDSDLALPLRVARDQVPVGTVNPSSAQTAGALKGNRDDGAGLHWWQRLESIDFQQCQLPNPAGGVDRPQGW